MVSCYDNCASSPIQAIGITGNRDLGSIHDVLSSTDNPQVDVCRCRNRCAARRPPIGEWAQVLTRLSRVFSSLETN